MLFTHILCSWEKHILVVLHSGNKQQNIINNKLITSDIQLFQIHSSQFIRVSAFFCVKDKSISLRG